MSQSRNKPSLGSAYIILYLDPMTYPLHFGDDPDYDPDAGSGMRPLTLEALTICIKKHEVQRVFFNLKSL